MTSQKYQKKKTFPNINKNKLKTKQTNYSQSIAVCCHDLSDVRFVYIFDSLSKFKRQRSFEVFKGKNWSTKLRLTGPRRERWIRRPSRERLWQRSATARVNKNIYLQKVDVHGVSSTLLHAALGLRSREGIATCLISHLRVVDARLGIPPHSLRTAGD